MIEWVDGWRVVSRKGSSGDFEENDWPGASVEDL